MPRSIPLPPPKLLEPELNTWTIQLKTITPMFGGSATPREVDVKNPVRAASVRGHLRFWWRATAGGQYTSAEELFKAEEEIWGSAKKQGKVAIKVVAICKGEKKPCAVFPEGKTFPNFGAYPGYALFPFQGKAKKDKRTGRFDITEQPAYCLVGIEFKVGLSYPEELDPQIRHAVSAWVKFGGIGARTRRGCGSIEFVEDEPSLTEVQRQYVNLLTLAPTKVLIGRNNSNAVAAWKESVELYKNFRQAEHFARKPRNEPKKPAGRSEYPEADSIRRMFPRERWKHQSEHSVKIGFPRANLGLPIGFHFTEEGPDESFYLEPSREGNKRFASPIITKAIKTTSGYFPAIVILQSPNVWEADDFVLRLEGTTKQVPRAQVELTPQERQSVSPLNGLPIREALLEYAKSKGFREVKL